MKHLGPFLLLAALLTSCSGDDTSSGMCAEGERTIEILEPLDGAVLTPADDLDPDMAGLQIQITVASCGFEFDEQIVIYLLDPVETSYAFVSAGSTGTASTIVPLVPGMLRMQARSMDDAVSSNIIALDVTL